MRELKPAELIVYLYIMSNRNKTDWAFSPQDIMNKTGLTDRSIRNAKHGLKEKGYWDENEQVFHQYRMDGKFFREEAEKDSKSSGKKDRTNIMTTCGSTNRTKDNMDTSSANGGSILDSPKEEEFYF